MAITMRAGIALDHIAGVNSMRGELKSSFDVAELTENDLVRVTLKPGAALKAVLQGESGM